MSCEIMWACKVGRDKKYVYTFDGMRTYLFGSLCICVRVHSCMLGMYEPEFNVFIHAWGACGPARACHAMLCPTACFPDSEEFEANQQRAEGLKPSAHTNISSTFSLALQILWHEIATAKGTGWEFGNCDSWKAGAEWQAETVEGGLWFVMLLLWIHEFCRWLHMSDVTPWRLCPSRMQIPWHDVWMQHHNWSKAEKLWSIGEHLETSHLFRFVSVWIYHF